MLRKTLCEHVNGLYPAGWLNEQSITNHWFQSVRTCPYSWATGRNSIFVQHFNFNLVSDIAIKLGESLHIETQVTILCLFLSKMRTLKWK